MFNRVHLVPFVHSLSYILIRVHLGPYYNLSVDPLELPQVPLGVPGPHFENQCLRRLCIQLYFHVLFSTSFLFLPFSSCQTAN